ncbi:MAG: hypothetical protein HYY18_05225 [Planctomycetes bacterium]|nr:hypothetical protein [Planctomycetota bacterium]
MTSVPPPRGIPLYAVAAIAVAALAMGATGGAWFMNGRQAAAPSPAPVVEKGAPAAGSPAGSQVGQEPAPPAEAASDLPAKLAAAEKETAALRERVAELEKLVPKPKTADDKIALAREMVECLRKGKSNPESFRRLLQLISELDPAMGPYFLERLADPDETADKDPLYDLALASGGPEVADWLLARLTDTGTPEDVRRRLLRVLGGGSKELFSIRSLPVQGRLADTAFQYVSTGNSSERQAGAGLLGGVDSTESRTVLYRLASTDADNSVREQAVRSLGHAGDGETLAWLDTFQATISGLEAWQQKRLQGAVDSARELLVKKYPR